MENKDIITPTEQLTIDTEQLVQQALVEKDSEELKRITEKFNLNMAKKSLCRVSAYDKLIDKVSSAMMERLDNYPDNFTNSELLDYLKTIHGAMEKTQRSLPNNVDTPLIQINQQNNFVDGGLDRDSRERVADFLKELLAQGMDVNEVIMNSEGDEDSDNNI